ncbi:MAG: hypothetical protein QRY71_05595, partial [Candidatus Rhabdochlamydia sp.]
EGNFYCNLANCLSEDEMVELLSGEFYTQKELYIKAIKLNPQEGNFYCNLANCLSEDEMVELLSGEFYTQKELYLKAIQLNPQEESS